MASSKIAVYAALFANIAIAVTKFIAAAVTGSSAMLSEGIHSVVDSGNEFLLLFGIKRSRKPPDENRPFGYGRELYFWSFIVSLLIFGVGAGLSFYEGITHLQHPEVIENPLWNYIVLGFAFVFDGTSFVIAVRQFNKERGSQSFWQAVKRSKDPTTFVVLFEDAADVLGIMVAFSGIWLGHTLQNPFFDGLASIVIGIILAAISVVLARESYGLLMGESASKGLLKQVIEMVKAKPEITETEFPLSVFLGPEEIVLVLIAAFKKELTVSEVTIVIDNLRKEIQNSFPYFKRVIIQVK